LGKHTFSKGFLELTSTDSPEHYQNDQNGELAYKKVKVREGIKGFKDRRRRRTGLRFHLTDDLKRKGTLVTEREGGGRKRGIGLCQGIKSKGHHR